MAISLVSVGAKITAAILNAVINAANANGQTLIVPTSVAGTGVSVSPTGVVSFTSATSVSLNGVFTGVYDNYIAVVDLTAGAGTSLVVRMRTSGTDDSAANYSAEYLSAGGTTVTAGNPTAGSNFSLVNGTGTELSGEIRFYGPALARPTRSLGQMYLWGGASAMTVTSSANRHNVAAAVDGFSVNIGSAATGTIRVYGLNNG